ncbi:MAG: acyl-CoA dehydrogenase family protein, partial [Cetobacterium sp.]
MDFTLTKSQELFKQMITAFAENEAKPLAAEIDEEERFPEETVKKMCDTGLMGIVIPTQYGGAGGDQIMYTMAVEELSKVCGTTGVILSA